MVSAFGAYKGLELTRRADLGQRITLKTLLLTVLDAEMADIFSHTGAEWAE
jgi:hypothetical protein